MAVKRKISGKGLSIPMGIGIGLVASICVMLIGALTIAYMVINETIEMESIGICAAIIQMLVSAIGAWLASWLTKEKRLMVCGITAAALLLILLSITAVFFDGMFSRIGLSALMILIGAGVPLLSLLRKKSPRNKIKIPAYR